MIDDILQSHADFKVWIAHAAPGEPWVYYRGFLMADREYKHLHPDLRPVPLVTDDLARTASKLEVEGGVFLTQKRMGFCDYEYIATKARKSSLRGRRPPAPTHRL
jgi:hypothetical protein